jgi:hypothetical protein
MGDMADDFLDSVMETEFSRQDYFSGTITDHEAYHRGIIDENGTYYDAGYRSNPFKTRGRTCRCCGQTGLLWGKIDGKFRLFDKENIHKCPVKRLNDTLSND